MPSSVTSVTSRHSVIPYGVCAVAAGMSSAAEPSSSAEIGAPVELSLPNAALRTHRTYYENKLRSAVYQDIVEQERPRGIIGVSAAVISKGLSEVAS